MGEPKGRERRGNQTCRASHRPSHRSAQTKCFSCSFGAAVEQQAAGNVGGFNKKWVSLCVQNQLRFLFMLTVLHKLI